MISADNIFLSEYKTTRGLVPFDRITTADYEPAIMQGIDEHNREIDSIANRAIPLLAHARIAFYRELGD